MTALQQEHLKNHHLSEAQDAKVRKDYDKCLFHYLEALYIIDDDHMKKTRDNEEEEWYNLVMNIIDMYLKFTQSLFTSSDNKLCYIENVLHYIQKIEHNIKKMVQMVNHNDDDVVIKGNDKNIEAWLNLLFMKGSLLLYKSHLNQPTDLMEAIHCFETALYFIWNKSTMITTTMTNELLLSLEMKFTYKLGCAFLAYAQRQQRQHDKSKMIHEAIECFTKCNFIFEKRCNHKHSEDNHKHSEEKEEYDVIHYCHQLYCCCHPANLHLLIGDAWMMMLQQPQLPCAVYIDNAIKHYFECVQYIGSDNHDDDDDNADRLNSYSSILFDIGTLRLIIAFSHPMFPDHNYGYREATKLCNNLCDMLSLKVVQNRSSENKMLLTEALCMKAKLILMKCHCCFSNDQKHFFDYYHEKNPIVIIDLENVLELLNNVIMYVPKNSYVWGFAKFLLGTTHLYKYQLCSGAGDDDIERAIVYTFEALSVFGTETQCFIKNHYYHSYQPSTLPFFYEENWACCLLNLAMAYLRRQTTTESRLTNIARSMFYLLKIIDNYCCHCWSVKGNAWYWALVQMNFGNAVHLFIIEAKHLHQTLTVILYLLRKANYHYKNAECILSTLFPTTYECAKLIHNIESLYSIYPSWRLRE